MHRSRPRGIRAFASRHRTVGLVFLVALTVLVAIRLALPFLVRSYVNRTIARLPDYVGTIGDVDVDLWRGAYSIDDIQLKKRDKSSGVDEPFFSAPRMDVSLEWRGLLHGAIVGELAFDRPQLTFVVAESRHESQTGIDQAWQAVLADLVPFRINSCTVSKGTFRWKDESGDPPVDLTLEDFHLLATNLTNIRDPEDVEEETVGEPPRDREESGAEDDRLVASLEASGRPLGHGTLWAHARIDPFAQSPTLDLDVNVRNVELVALNDFTKKYAGFDAERGRFHVSAEFACADGRIVGYVAPFFEDADIASTEEIENVGDVFTFLWESVVGTAAEALENQSQDRVATKVPLEGRVEGPSPDVFATVGNLLVNAFIRALVPGVEGSVDLRDAEEEKTEGEKREGAEETARRRKAEATPGKKPSDGDSGS